MVRFRANSAESELLTGYLPFVLGPVSVWLCLKARKRAKHKALILACTFLLAPIAFSYPAWTIYLWFMWVTGRYSGPMP